MKTHLAFFSLFSTVCSIIFLCIFQYFFQYFFDDKLSRVHWCKKLKWSDMLLKCLQRPNSKCPRSPSPSLLLSLLLSLSSQRLALALLCWGLHVSRRYKTKYIACTCRYLSVNVHCQFFGLVFSLSELCCACQIVVVVAVVAAALCCSCSVMNNNANVKSWKLICRARAAAASD